MTENIQVGKIEQLTLDDLHKSAHTVADLARLGITAKEGNPRELNFVEAQKIMSKHAMENPIERAKEEGRREQFKIDCEAECTACGKPDKYYPAVWTEADNTYQHEVVATGKMEYCDATVLKMYWSDTHGDKQ